MRIRAFAFVAAILVVGQFALTPRSAQAAHGERVERSRRPSLPLYPEQQFEFAKAITPSQ